MVAVFAAGASRRLGQAKQLVPIDGQPLLRRQCRVALEAGVGDVVLILGSRADEFRTCVADLPLEIRINPSWNEGLGSSLREAARFAIETGAAGLLILHGDQFQIRAQDIRAITSAWLAAGGLKACRAVYGEYAGPPVVLPQSCFESLTKLSGDEGAKKVLAALGRENVIDVDMPTAASDLDTPAQLDQLRRG